jgi:hypothetical protein
LKYLGDWQDRATLAKISHFDGKRSLDMRVKVNQETGNMATAEAELSEISRQLGENTLRLSSKQKLQINKSKRARSGP